MKKINKQYGLTLIELLVTLAISAVILTGVVTLYVSSLSQSKLTTNLTSIQESGRFALDLISRDLRMSGYTGCLAYDQIEETDNPDLTKPVSFWGLKTRGGQNFVNQAGRGIQGGEAAGTAWGQAVSVVTGATARVGTLGSQWAWSGNVMTDNYADAIAGSDIVRVWTTGDIAVDSSGVDDTTGAIVIKVPVGNGLKVGDMVMYATCGNRVFGEICATTNTSITLSNACNDQYTAVTSLGGGLRLTADTATANISGGEVFSYRDVTYFVGKRDTDQSTAPSLYRAVGGVSREMVEGVENLQILYGVDVDHAEGAVRVADKYVTAAQVGSRWNDVVSVKVSLLMRSFEKRIAQGSNTISFNGTTITTNDGYFRQVYSTTIALRNRTVGEADGMYQ